MLTPKSPCPPQLLLGVICTSLTDCVLLLYTSILIVLSMFFFNNSLRVSLSWSSLMFSIATIKSKNGSKFA